MEKQPKGLLKVGKRLLKKTTTNLPISNKIAKKRKIDEELSPTCNGQIKRIKKQSTNVKTTVKSSVKCDKKVVKCSKKVGDEPMEVDSNEMSCAGKKSAEKENLITNDTPLSQVKKLLKSKLKNGVQLTRKERRQLKRANRRDGDVALRCLQLWEVARCGSASEKLGACDKILELVRGKVSSFAYAHDSVRVLETLLKFGNERHRWTVFEEVKGEVRAMCMSKYARFLVTKVLSYGTGEQRASVIRSFEGHVVRLMRHREASALIEQAYNDHANSIQRATLQQEFYGPQFALFKSADVRCLQDALKAAESSGRAAAIMSYQRKVLESLANKGHPMRYSLVQQVLFEFLEAASSEDVAHLAESLSKQLVGMLHTRVGTKSAIRLLWALGARERLQVLRTLKSFVVNIACDEHGYLWLLALLEAVKRPAPLVKYLLKELLSLEDMERVLSSASARKVLLYVLRPRAPQHFPPVLMKLFLFPSADNTLDEEKWSALRQSLLSSSLLAYLAANLKLLSRSSGALVILLEVLQNAERSAQRTELLLALCSQLCAPFEPSSSSSTKKSIAKQLAQEVVNKRRVKPSFQGSDSDDEPELSTSKPPEHTMHLVESPAGHFVLRQLLLKRLSSALPEVQEETVGDELAVLLLQEANDETLLSWTRCNRGGFLLLHLCKERPALLFALKKRLLPHMKILQGRARGSKGVQELVNNLRS